MKVTELPDYERYYPDLTKPRALVFDIDGTVALHDGLRGHYEYSKVDVDVPNWPVIHMLEALAASGIWKMVAVSGRMRTQECEEKTRAWITMNMPVTAKAYFLYMRDEADFRQDFVVKNEIFNSYIAPSFWVEFTVDDRKQVVDMWRKMGLVCAQVAEGDF